MRLLPFSHATDVGVAAAHWVAIRLLQHKATAEKPFVLGLPTGSTPLGMYIELIRLHREGSLSFEHVITFNMDEYVGLPKAHPESYWTFMHRNFFDHIDIKPESVNILNGNTDDHEAECARFESKIASCGKINLFVCGVGHDGHIAFNEPGSSLASRTRVKTLVEATREQNSRFFGNDITQVPKLSLTVGIATILDASELIILATGASKAQAVQAGVEGAVNHLWTVSCLQLHRYTSLLCDIDAAMELKLRTVKHFESIEAPNMARLLRIFSTEDPENDTFEQFHSASFPQVPQ